MTWQLVIPADAAWAALSLLVMGASWLYHKGYEAGRREQ